MAVSDFPYESVYPSDLSDEEWGIIRPLIPPSPPVDADREVDIRKVVNGILYVNRSGCQRRMLPKEYDVRILSKVERKWYVAANP